MAIKQLSKIEKGQGHGIISSVFSVLSVIRSSYQGFAGAYT